MQPMRVIVGAVILAVLLVAPGLAQNKFVGAKKCMACHKSEKLGGTAYTVWEKSAHAKAYQTLTGEAAKKIAADKGMKTAPNEAPECLKCHVAGGGTAKNVEATFKKEEGVTCESCHGAASGYLALHSKKSEADKAKAKEAGLLAVERNEKSCVTCHNAESPTFKGFKFEEMWAKIEHSKPAKK